MKEYQWLLAIPNDKSNKTIYLRLKTTTVKSEILATQRVENEAASSGTSF